MNRLEQMFRKEFVERVHKNGVICAFEEYQLEDMDLENIRLEDEELQDAMDRFICAFTDIYERCDELAEEWHKQAKEVDARRPENAGY